MMYTWISPVTSLIQPRANSKIIKQIVCVGLKSALEIKCPHVLMIAAWGNGEWPLEISVAC